MNKKKILLIVLSILLVGFLVFFYFRFYFVFGEGVKAGQINYVEKKGYIFKTYEGKVIQSGFKSSKSGNSTIQNYEFRFSIENSDLADSLMRCSGKEVELHYKEYFAPLPWRGYSEFIVDSIVAVH
ncbi:MAG: hypothetical protein KIG42_08260 [Paludibacteraceae bacterium]|nr:hypothetical protein [Paludibacteraceae bacterium]